MWKGPGRNRHTARGVKKNKDIKGYILGAGVVILAGIILFSVSIGSPKSLSGLNRSLGRLFYPFELLLSYTYDGISSVIGDYILLVQTEEKNEQLQREIAKLRLENHKLRAALDNLADLLPVEEYRKRLEFKTKTARVIAAGMPGASNELTIDLGEEDGIKTDMGVIVPEGVVGVITKVLPGVSVVRLLSDPEAAIDATIPDTKVRGIVGGRSEGNQLRCKFSFVEHADEIKDGDLLVTTGMDQRFPPGLPIGKIVLKEGNQTGQEQETFMVRPAVEFESLRHVLVITSINW